MRTSVFILLFMIIAVFSSLLPASDNVTHSDARIQAAVMVLDNEFDSCFQWWADIYDPASGGFFYSLSSKQSPKYGPFIEATSKAVHVLEWTGILEETSPEFKAGIIRYFQVRQNSKTGFFRDPDYADQYDHKMLSRALGMSMGALEACGAKALYSHPMDQVEENVEAQAHYKHLESTESFAEWINKLTWETRVWTAGASLLTQVGTINRLEEPRRSALIECARENVLKRQLENGYFGNAKEPWYSQLSGSYKTASFLEGLGIPIPRMDLMQETTLKHLFETPYNNVIVLYNTTNMLSILHRNHKPIDLELRIRIVEQCAKILSTLKGPDGAFVTIRDKAEASQNGIRLAENVIESNTNATGLAHKARSILLTLLLDKDGPHPHPRQNDMLLGINKKISEASK